MALFSFPTKNLYASDDETALITTQTTSDQPAFSPFGENDKGHRTALLLNYVRGQVPGVMPRLQEDLRTPIGWAKSIGHAFGSGDDDNADGAGGGFLSGLMQPPSAETGEAAWMTPGYHHKGFLPFHDAMTTGMNFRERALGDRVQFDVKPFYGQNWVSLNGYGGAELGIGLTRPGESQPWGHIALRYIDGAANLMDQGRGFDMTAELRFNANLSLTAGANNSDTSDLGNYAILRWKLVSFGP